MRWGSDRPYEQNRDTGLVLTRSPGDVLKRDDLTV